MNDIADPALLARDRAVLASQGYDFVLTRRSAPHLPERAIADVEAAEAAFASVVPSTPQGIAIKLEAVQALLAGVIEGDELTPEGAAGAWQHINSLLAAVAQWVCEPGSRA